MAPSGGRRPWSPAAAYFLLLAVIVLLLAGGYLPAPAVRPALAGASGTPPSPPSWLEVRLRQPFWRMALQSGLPLLNAEPVPEAADEAGGLLPGLWAGLPLSLLRFGLPGLSLANLPPPSFERQSPTAAPATSGGSVGPAASLAAPAPKPAPAQQPADPEYTECGSAAPTVLIYHTHSEESFLSLLPAGTPSDQAFTTDRARSIVRVGDE